MIVKQFEISKINFKDKNFYLFYGENEGHKNQILADYFKPFYKNKTYNYDEKEILENKNNFFNSILTKSFFEENKLIVIARSTDKIKDTIQEVILKDIINIKIILLAGILEKKSKLRNFFEKEKNTVCIPFYSDSRQTLDKISINFFKEKKIPISQEVINLLIERCRGDRENLKNELQKIESFTKFKKTISYEDIQQKMVLRDERDKNRVESPLIKAPEAHFIDTSDLDIEDVFLLARSIIDQTSFAI